LVSARRKFEQRLAQIDQDTAGREKSIGEHHGSFGEFLA
jgi:hypothetical protein